MLEFMDWICNAFYDATLWNRDNSYASLNATPNALLAFPIPKGFRLNVASLATPHFSAAYQLGSAGHVDGFLSYLYSSAALENVDARSESVPLRALLRSYRKIRELHDFRPASGPAPPGHGPDHGPGASAAAAAGNSLLYGRLYLPSSMLEAMYIKRFRPSLQMQIKAVSDRTLRDGGTLLGMLQYDKGRYTVEGLASTDGGLLGVRGLYNFGGELDRDAVDAEAPLAPAPSIGDDAVDETRPPAPAPGSGNPSGGPERERIYGRFSTGAELYYGTLNKSGGMSLGARFATLPSHRGTPLTATVTVNPLMGNIAASYAVEAGRRCSLATRLDFNVYSYESAWAVGMEVWRRPLLIPGLDSEMPTIYGNDANRTFGERSFRAKLEWREDRPEERVGWKEAPREKGGAVGGEDGRADEEEYAGVIKARLDQKLNIGLLWEGRLKALLFSVGTAVDLRRPDQPFRTLGLEVQYSS